jgi:hypothetical protein
MIAFWTMKQVHDFANSLAYSGYLATMRKLDTDPEA